MSCMCEWVISHTWMRHVTQRQPPLRCLMRDPLALKIDAAHCGLDDYSEWRIVCCSVLQCVAVCCSVLQFVAVCVNLLQCVAVCCSALQYVAVCCSVECSAKMTWHTADLMTTVSDSVCDAACCGHGVAVWCSVVQCGVVCCSAKCGAKCSAKHAVAHCRPDDYNEWPLVHRT